MLCRSYLSQHITYLSWAPLFHSVNLLVIWILSNSFVTTGGVGEYTDWKNFELWRFMNILQKSSLLLDIFRYVEHTLLSSVTINIQNT